MADVLTIGRPLRRSGRDAASARDAGLARLRLGLRMLAIEASAGAGSERLAGPLHDLHAGGRQFLQAAPPAERMRWGTAFVGGVCALARWFDPARTAQAVPPLCVVLWHVGRAFTARDPATLWIDFVLPDDTRRVAAVDWAQDVRLLLMQADIPHRAESALVTPRPATSAPTRPGPPELGAWGCMALLHAYRCSGETSRSATR